jgi:hypothetical protein
MNWKWRLGYAGRNPQPSAGKIIETCLKSQKQPKPRFASHKLAPERGNDTYCKILFFAGETSAKRNFLLECIVVSVVDQFESDVESGVSGCSGLI